jgi:opacity protein-like surface antigen
MKAKWLLVMALMFLSANLAFAQKHEIAFTSGGLKVGEKGFDLPNPGFVKFKTGFTYEINYAQRLVDAKLAALYFEIPLAGTPRTKVTTTNALAPRSYSSLFVATGLKLKLIPGAKYSPFAMTGVGISRFNSSSTLTGGQANPNQKAATDGVFYIGGGLDVKLISKLSLRGEVRDFYSEIPPLNINALRSRQHNALISAGVVINF